MVVISTQDQKFNLTAKAIASYFKHKCDRNFRYETVDQKYRHPNRGIGWNVPPKVRNYSRAGIHLLLREGNHFELSHVQALVAAHGEMDVLTAGFTTDGKVEDLPFSRMVERLAAGTVPRFVAQLAIDLNQLPGLPEKFLAFFGLNPEQLKLGVAKPDLVELVKQDTGGYRLRIWDFKASQVAKHEHFIQVAFYSYLLDFALSESGLTGFTVNREEGVIQSRKGEEPFALEPYRKALKDFLQNRVPVLLRTKAADAHFHVEDHCSMCEYLDHCRREADAGSDLSRIAYLSSESKRHLRKRGIRSHRDLAELDDAGTIEALQQTSHDLSRHLPRYITAAQALEDGIPRSLETRTMLMPKAETVRIVLCAEGDAVTGTCFALGLKKFRWDPEGGKPDTDEQVFVAETKGDEAGLLLRFLKVLNRHLEETDRHNRQVHEEALGAATREKEAADEALGRFKLQHPRLLKARPEHQPLLEEREHLQKRQETADKQYKAVKSGNDWHTVRKWQRTLHFYVYDSYDLFVLRSLVERQLFNEQNPDRRELLVEISALVKLFPPASVLSDPDTFRTIPGTVVTEVLRKMVALPTPYIYDLKAVSEIYRPVVNGQEDGYVFNYKYGFGWEFTNQVAFERIHDYWEGKPFRVDPREYTPREVYEQIRATLLSKLRATDSVIRQLKQQFGDALLLRKEPFRLHTSFNPVDFRTLEALKVFTLLESALEELDIRHTHTLSSADRNAKFVCIRGMQYIKWADEADGSLWFTFSAESRDTKFGPGEFNLVVTHEDDPGMLLGNVDGKLFEANKFSAAPYKVSLVAYDLTADPPRVRLKPDHLTKFREKVDLGKVCILDQLYIDYNSGKVIDVLQRLNASPENALHIQGCLDNSTLTDWQPVVGEVEALEARLLEVMSAAGKRFALNAGQQAAWRGVFKEPVTLLWGPPGTGKTHTVAHMLIGYALAAKRNNQPIRVLVTAFTHHAITNVLNKVSELAERYGISGEELRVVKFTRGGNAADEELLPAVEQHTEDTMAAHLESLTPCLVAGATVWGTYKGMREAGQIIQSWFDVVLVDEASQMKLPDALIAFGAGKPHSNIILAGDDMQLPPIIHGTYAEEQEFMLSSVFAFIRHQINQAMAFDPTIRARRLFQLSENFRMNEPITAYPRDMLYGGKFQSANPGIRIQTTPAIAAGSTDLLDFLLHPDRPVVLCWYTPPVSYTARNPVEAELAALLAARLSQTLVDRKTGALYTPEKFASHGLGVLSPHRAQNSIIRQYLAEQGFDFQRTPLLVDTVEKLQGKEREVILVSYGVADEEYATAEAGFLLNRNRFNVAITRALCKVIVFCSEPVLNVISTDRKVLLESMMLKEFRSYCDTGHQIIAWKPSVCDELNLHIQWKGF
jgi:predicted RecB family nuclease